ncbi:MAG: MBL fold metallo-hydrolase [Bacteroidales bacterium]|nr:MBL fold metallo-hydrolase [Bacteroidales bacterium]MCL2133300.1 MBL fold metallo-hydrolase [Bacteroidales bacterium]
MKRIKLLFMSVLMTSLGAFAQNIFTYKVGDCEVSMLSEVQQSIKPELLIGATPEMLEECAPDGTIPNAMSAYLIRMPEKIVLIDAGIGTNLFDNLFSLGIKPEEVDAILITHAHFDHIGGLLQDGKLMFPNAELYISELELEHWKNEKSQGGERARQVLKAYKGQRHTFQPVDLEDETTFLIPGIQAIAAFGHTPGHTVYLLSSDKDKMLFWGDLTHAMAIQMPYPEVALTYDIDPATAIDRREVILNHVAKHSIPIAGIHIAYPGMGLIKKSNKGYLFTPFK